MMSELAYFESEVSALAERDDVPREDLLRLLMDIPEAIRRLRAAQRELEQFIIRWLPRGESLVVGDIRHYVTDKKTVRCRNVAAAITALYEGTNGDFEAFVQCLRSDPIKHGEARKVLGDRFDLYFETVVEEDLDHRPVKELASVNERFVKGR